MGADAISSAPPPVANRRYNLVPYLSAASLVIDDFLPIDLANGMRQGIDDHFANPNRHRPDSHQIWNYWYVPELYTYLRTNPGKIMKEEYVQTFMNIFQAWCIDKLGMSNVTWPYLSMYVPGCRQELHNDSVNGRFAFVYSLTRNERLTSGGETIIFHEGDPFRSKLTRPDAGRGFFDKVAPRFNRLVLFDDRLPHAVERIDGSQDPVEGRFVFHGHVSEGGSIVIGSLPANTVHETVQAAVASFSEENRDTIGRYHGPLVLRFWVSETGTVASCDILVDRIASPLGDQAEAAMLIAGLVNALSLARFPAAPTETVVTLPVLFGGSLPTST